MGEINSETKPTSTAISSIAKLIRDVLIIFAFISAIVVFFWKSNIKPFLVTEITPEVLSKMPIPDGNLSCIPSIESGSEVLVQQLPKNKDKVFSVPFRTDFLTPPEIVVGLTSFSSHMVPNVGWVGVSVNASTPTKKDFKIEISATDWDIKSATVHWVAYGCKK